jgi:hypothetical protein
MFAVCFCASSHASVFQVKPSLPRAGKKPTGKKGISAAAAEVRILVTVLMGYSFEHFGGPDAVEESMDKDANGVEGSDKRTRPRSRRNLLTTDAGAWPAETASTQAADTDDAEVALNALRNSSPCDRAQPVVTEPVAHTACHVPGSSCDRRMIQHSITSQQELAGDSEKATDRPATTAACKSAAGNDAEAAQCSLPAEHGTLAALADDLGLGEQDQPMQDIVMSGNAKDTTASGEWTPAETNTRARSSDQEGMQCIRDGTAVLAHQDAAGMSTALGRCVDIATDTANSKCTDVVTSNAEEACREQAACNSRSRNCNAERHNHSRPAELLERHVAVDKADEECKQEGCIGDTVSREQPYDAAGCEPDANTEGDKNVQTLGGEPVSRQAVGELPATNDFSHAEELHAALHDPSSLDPRVRPPPAELIICQPSTSVRICRWLCCCWCHLSHC